MWNFYMSIEKRVMISVKIKLSNMYLMLEGAWYIISNIILYVTAIWRPGAPLSVPAGSPRSPGAPLSVPGGSPRSPGAPPPPPPPPVWTPGSEGASPQTPRKTFRPVHFEETPPARRKFAV